MRPFLIRATQVLAIGMICAGLWAERSHAEKMSPANLRQLCKTGGGTFFKEPNGKYACMFPSSVDMAYEQVREDIYCTARGECERITWCGSRPCEGKFPRDKRGEGTPGKKPPKPTKLEGVLTAGTADQRGAGVSSGTTAGVLNPNLGGSSSTNSSLSSSTGAASSVSATANRSTTGIAKPSAIPPQLAERLRRLQQQQQR
jgi:hypothetical protein